MENLVKDKEINYEIISPRCICIYWFRSKVKNKQWTDQDSVWQHKNKEVILEESKFQ